MFFVHAKRSSPSKGNGHTFVLYLAGVMIVCKVPSWIQDLFYDIVNIDKAQLEYNKRHSKIEFLSATTIRYNDSFKCRVRRECPIVIVVSVASDQPTHPGSLIQELDCPQFVNDGQID